MADITFLLMGVVVVYSIHLGLRVRANSFALSLNAGASCVLFLAGSFLLFQFVNASLRFQVLTPISLYSLLSAASVQFTLLQQALLLSGLITSGVFITIITTKPSSITNNALFALLLLAVISFVFCTTESVLLFLTAFELLLLTSLYLLRLTSKSERVVEASIEMFFWTLFGSLALLTLFFWLSLAGNFSFSSGQISSISAEFIPILALVGFGVKIPVWPFFSWLLKAHVEASVEFSILLSGFIVKLGVFGLAKIFSLTFSVLASPLLFAFSLLGLLVATCRLFAQRDLKRIVALTTVIEMNWLGMCLALGSLTFDNLVSYLIVAHSVTTALEFFLIEIITKRYGVRDAILVSGLFAKTPLLAVVSFFIILITIGFPGTPLFLAKFLFLTELASQSWGLSLLIGSILLLALPLFFIKLWAPIWFGLPARNASVAYDLTLTELTLFGVLFSTAILLSFWPALLLHY